MTVKMLLDKMLDTTEFAICDIHDLLTNNYEAEPLFDSEENDMDDLIDFLDYVVNVFNVCGKLIIYI